MVHIWASQEDGNAATPWRLVADPALFKQLTGLPLDAPGDGKYQPVSAGRA